MQSDPREGLHVAIIMDGNGRWRRDAVCPASQVIALEFPQCGVWWNAHLIWALLA